MIKLLMNCVVVFFVWAVTMLISQKPIIAIKAAIVTALPINVFDIVYCTILWQCQHFMQRKYNEGNPFPETTYYQYRQHILSGSLLFVLLVASIILLATHHYKISF